MPYDPNLHHRRSIRLPGYDYASAGAYFITICTAPREHLFGTVQHGEMHLNEFGRIVEDCWYDLPNHYTHVVLDAFVVMPDHVHGIIVLVKDTLPLRRLPLHPTTIVMDCRKLCELSNHFLHDASTISAVRPACRSGSEIITNTSSAMTRNSTRCALTSSIIQRGGPRQVDDRRTALKFLCLLSLLFEKWGRP